MNNSDKTLSPKLSKKCDADHILYSGTTEFFVSDSNIELWKSDDQGQIDSISGFYLTVNGARNKRKYIGDIG